MNANNMPEASLNIWNVINVIENHFDVLCGINNIENTKIAFQDVPFSIQSESPLKANSNKSGLLRLAMVGSPERTLQGEVFYAIRENEKNLGGSAVLEMKVSEWKGPHRNIDCVISPKAPNDLRGSIFIELGHYSTVQSKPCETVRGKIERDFESSSCVSDLGPVLHVMFVTHVSEFDPNKTAPNEVVRNWPRLPGYFVKGWGAKTSQLTGSTYKQIDVSMLNDIHRELVGKFTTPKIHYLGHVGGCDETVILGTNSLRSTGRVDRFYSVSYPAGQANK